MKNCPVCKKSLVHPDDWGDYDDACEWGCTGCISINYNDKYWEKFWKIKEVNE